MVDEKEEKVKKEETITKIKEKFQKDQKERISKKRSKKKKEATEVKEVAPTKYGVTLEELVDLATRFLNHEAEAEEFDKLMEKTYIRAYIPIQEKMSIIMAVLTYQMYSDTQVQEIRITELYKNIFFFVLLEQYGGIKCTGSELINYENYDLLYPLVSSYFYSFCKDDYEMVKEMIKDSMNMYDIQDFANAISSINMDTIKDETDKMKGAIDSLQDNKELISNLKDIAAFNDPTTKQFLDLLRDQAVKESNR